MSDPIRQAIPTPEQLQAMAAGFGRVAQLMVGTMVELLAPIAKRELAKAYGSQPVTMWRSLARHIDPTFGRKRRARRARGRRIEARRARGPGLLTVHQWAAAYRTMQAQQLATFADPSLGVPWEEQADG
jgi:hypothetical protein